MEGGCELTYDYGAAGSAGGRGINHDQSRHQECPISKMPRTGCAERNVGSRRDGKVSHTSESLSRQKEAPIAEKDEKSQGLTAGDPDGLRKADEAHPVPSRRRECLCGSQNCRRLLPCNRAIL